MMAKPTFFENYEYNIGLYNNRTPQELQYLAQRNLNELITLLNRLFERYSRLLVVRIDLKYKREVASQVPIEVAQMHREQLLWDRREHPEAFDWMVGYAWGLEYGDDGSGFHYHLLAIYDGSQRQQDFVIGLAISKLWDQITGGYGYCKVSNFQKNEFLKNGTLGIGMINRNDVQLRINLVERVAAYITKKSAALDFESGRTESGSFRTFGKSWMPQPLDPNVPRRGRPPVNRPDF